MVDKKDFSVIWLKKDTQAALDDLKFDFRVKTYEGVMEKLLEEHSNKKEAKIHA